MKTQHLLFLLLFASLSLNLKCEKEQTPEGYFFMCKLDGNEYRASGGSCVNCIAGSLIKDTTLIVSGKRGGEHIGIGINDNESIKEKIYILNNIIGRQGVYDNSITINDSYFTDSVSTGELKITKIDKVKKEIEGTFYFKAYSPVQNKSINITEGKFRINYRDY